MTASSPAAPASTFAFIFVRSLRNAAMARVRRLKEPRYLVGLVIAVAYFGMLLRPSPRREAARKIVAALPPESLEVQLLAFAAFLFAAFCVVWIFKGGNAALSLSEGEIQFLLPAPLTRKSIVHFSLLRPQLPLLFTSFIFTFFLGRGGRTGPGLVYMFLGGWIALTTMQLHTQGLAFWKAGLSERRFGSRFAVKVLMSLAALAGLFALGRWLWQGTIAFPGIQRTKDPLGTLARVWEGLLPWRSRFVPTVLLFPFKRLLAPAFAPDAARFLLALPGALALGALNYFWALSANVSFEEATLAAAQERARRKAARGSGQAEALPSEARRRVVPFLLAPSGRPEVAIVWKNLLSLGRIRLSVVFGSLAVLPAAAFAIPVIVLGRSPEYRDVFAHLPVGIAVIGAAFMPMMPFALRYDLRRDLVRADLLKLWPIDPVRLAAAELVVPWGMTLLVLLTGVLTSLAMKASLVVTGSGSAEPSLPLLASAALAALLIVPPVVGAILVLQNGATLALPAWFPPGERRAAGLEATGVRLLTFFATFLALALAAIPSLLLGGVIVWLGKAALGSVVWPLAALAASIPFWGEVYGGLLLLGTLFRRFDPSADLTP